MPVPLLADDLTPTQRVSLAGLKQHPGFAVLELLFMSACKRATEDVIKLDPVEEGYERKLKALQTKARERNEFSLLILKSIDWQTQSITQPEDKSKPQENRIVKAIQSSKGIQ